METNGQSFEWKRQKEQVRLGSIHYSGRLRVDT